MATWSVFNNLLAVPLAGAIMSLGLISCGVGLVFLPLARILAAANSILITLFLKIIAFTASLPLAYLHVPPPGPLFLTAYYALLLLLPRLFPGEEKEGVGKGQKLPYRALALGLVLYCSFPGLVLSVPPSGGHLLSVGAGMP